MSTLPTFPGRRPVNHFGYKHGILSAEDVSLPGLAERVATRMGSTFAIRAAYTDLQILHTRMTSSQLQQ